MAEIRKHNPTTSDIGEQVRALLGETIRPVTPGAAARTKTAHQQVDDDMFDPFDQVAGTDEETTDDDAAEEPGSVSAGGDPLIGVLPAGFTPVFFDGETAA